MKLSRFLIWIALFAVIAFLYIPMIPPMLLAVRNPATGQFTLDGFRAIFLDATLINGILNSLILAAVVGVITPLLGLVAARAVRALPYRRSIVTILLLPLFIPGISMGVSTSLFFNIMGVSPSLFTMAVVQILWALPFAFLIILTVMSGFDTIYLEAAYTCGANKFQSFMEIELPQIATGLSGAATFSVILSFNETIRTSVVQGGNNTIQTFIWSRYQQVGLTPDMYALMALVILVTLILVALMVALGSDRSTAGDIHA